MISNLNFDFLNRLLRFLMIVRSRSMASQSHALVTSTLHLAFREVIVGSTICKTCSLSSLDSQFLTVF